jgi:hypothetical protein
VAESKWPQFDSIVPSGKNQYITTCITTLFKFALKPGGKLDSKLERWSHRRQKTCKAMIECGKQMKINNYDKSELFSDLLSKVMGQAQHAVPPDNTSYRFRDCRNDFYACS